jgi:hypothetical protein
MKGLTQVRQGLVQWSHLPASLSTWEDLEFLHQQFPRATVWGHPGVHGGGDVRTASSTLPDVEAVTDGLQAKEPLDAEGARPKWAKV